MPIAKVSSRFRERFQSWVRLEPRCRVDDFGGGIEARTADPLWMLTRQWQTGELTGDDAASPIEVSLRYATQGFDKVRLDPSGSAEDLPAAPLELVVEQESLGLSWRDRISIGQEFESIALAVLGADAPALIHACRMQFPLVLPYAEEGAVGGGRAPSKDEWVRLDRATRRMLKLAAGRVADGKRLLEALADASVTLPAGITEEQLAAVAAELHAWCRRMNLRSEIVRSPAWRNQQLDYRFELDPPVDPPADPGSARAHLVAPDYRNGALDWHSFNVVDAATDGWTEHPPVTTLPTPVSIGGTSPRWWAFEDGATNFGKLEVAKPDLAKLLLMEFLLIYGDDWFSVPLPVAMPNLVRIDELSLNNVFGETVSIGPARVPDPNPLFRFELFTLSPASTDQLGVCDTSSPGCGDFLLLPPVAGYREESPAREEIRFLRDESANMVWGVEQTISNGLGQPVDGFDAQRERIELREREEALALEAERAVLQRRLRLDGLTREQQLQLMYIDGRLWWDDLTAGKREELLEARAQLVEQTLTEEQRDELLSKSESIDAALTRLREGPPRAAGSVPSFRLATTVPENWIPFAPMNASDYTGRPGVRLRRAQMLRNVRDEEPAPIEAMSRLLELEEDPLLWLEEAAVPRVGRRLMLTGQRMRWVDGKTYVWKGRKVLAGRGEGNSGLKFDTIGPDGE